MNERKQYVVTVASCSCDAESAYVDLTDEEFAMLERVDKALDKWGGAICVVPAEDADEYSVERAEANARCHAITISGETDLTRREQP